jgi:hypothetical protein
VSEAVEPGADVFDDLEPAGVQVVQAFLDQSSEAGHASGFVGVRAGEGRVERGFTGGHGVEAKAKWGFLKAGAS